jgi:hypothetical protein
VPGYVIEQTGQTSRTPFFTLRPEGAAADAVPRMELHFDDRPGCGWTAELFRPAPHLPAGVKREGVRIGLGFNDREAAFAKAKALADIMF